MFLGEFSKEEQAIFLNLAYTMMYADHELKDDEREKFQLYQKEVEADITKAEVVDFVAELAKFQNLDITKRRCSCLNCWALPLPTQNTPKMNES